MAKQGKTHWLFIVALVALAITGCASQGVQKKLTAGDAALLTGTWGGTVNPPGTTGMVPGSLTIRPDGSYSTNAGAYSTSGKAEIKDGFVQFFSTAGSGLWALGDPRLTPGSTRTRPVRASHAVKTRAAVARRAIVLRDFPRVCWLASQLRSVRRSRSSIRSMPRRVQWSSKDSRSRR